MLEECTQEVSCSVVFEKQVGEIQFLTLLCTSGARKKRYRRHKPFIVCWSR